MANNVTVKDQAGATQTVKTTDTAGVHTPHQNIDAIAAGTNDIGNVGTRKLTTVACGELQGSASALQMPSVACSLVRFKAQNDNAGNVYIGGASVTKPDGTTDTTTGLMLDAGDDTGWIPTDNLNRFYRICDNAGDDLTYIALT